MSHELTLEVSELKKLVIRCAQCGTEVSLNIEKLPKVPEKCPSCEVAFERLYRNAVENFMSACLSLADQLPPVTLRIAQRPTSTE